jgi:cation transport ATPase
MPGHHHLSMGGNAVSGLLATGIHTAAYLAVTGVVAWVVYRKLGLALLRKTWFNVDLLWAAALVATGLITLIM